DAMGSSITADLSCFSRAFSRRVYTSGVERGTSIRRSGAEPHSRPIVARGVGENDDQAPEIRHRNRVRRLSPGTEAGPPPASSSWWIATEMEGAMTPANVLRGVVGFFEHAVAVIVGFVLMVIGLALGVTMIMLPAGVVIGLLGFAIF